MKKKVLRLIQEAEVELFSNIPFDSKAMNKADRLAYEVFMLLRATEMAMREYNKEVGVE